MQALEAVQKYGLQTLLNSKGVHAVGVGVKDDTPFRSAKGNDFSVTAVVSNKRTIRDLAEENILPFSDAFKRDTANTFAEPVEINVVESGGPPRLEMLLVPKIQRGQYGGRRPLLDTQKRFNSLRCGIRLC